MLDSSYRYLASTSIFVIYVCSLKVRYVTQNLVTEGQFVMVL